MMVHNQQSRHSVCSQYLALQSLRVKVATHQQANMESEKYAKPK
jgi:hypothetical protein